MRYKPSRNALLAEFYQAPPEALFSQAYIAAVRGCSTAKLERDRWAGTGIPFIKLDGAVRYRKKDVLEHDAQYKRVRSTAEAQATEDLTPALPSTNSIN